MPPPQKRRAFLLVLDSVGIGAMPDAAAYNDPLGCNTLANVAAACHGLYIPHLESLGIGHIHPIQGVDATKPPRGAYGKMAERAPGKDTATGHWEMAGAILEKPLALFPNGFPEEIIAPFVERTGRGILANCAASGTEIIEQLGQEHQRTGKWIVYTSADSVFQIAAHEGVIPLAELYRACEIARDILNPYNVGRVIARPYIGEVGQYARTDNRKDYALDPPTETVLDRLCAAGVPVIGVGKIGNIFNHRGITTSHHTHDNADGMRCTIELAQSQTDGLIFINLVDFDAKFGHRNDPKGYGAALEQFDHQLGELLPLIKADDLFVITADHGCDPTVPGTDHSREYVPLLATHRTLSAGTSLGTRETFADIAQTLAQFWDLAPMPYGSSFLRVPHGA